MLKVNLNVTMDKFVSMLVHVHMEQQQMDMRHDMDMLLDMVIHQQQVQNIQLHYLLQKQPI